MQSMRISRVDSDRAAEIAEMMGELLGEIMDRIEARAFNFVLDDAKVRLRQFLAKGKYHVFAAVDEANESMAGFVAMYESYSIYAGGAFGTIPELYVRPGYRGRQVGKALLETAKRFGAEREWTRLEVTTPPLPEFERTLSFYQREGFSVSGGRKLQVGL